MLIVFGGLPGTGKSTIARRLAERLRATYIRIDSIEQALRSCGTLPAGVVTEGYAVGYRMAEDNLRAGNTVIADSVNPLMLTRDAWVNTATSAAAPVVEVEVVCSDLAEHRRRVETRISDIPGLLLPAWDAVQSRVYEPWNRARIMLDTAARTIDAEVAELCRVIQRDRR
jgi:predicted kinase